MDIAFKLECLRLADGNVRRAQEMAEWLAGVGVKNEQAAEPYCTSPDDLFVRLTASEAAWLVRLLRREADSTPSLGDYRSVEGLLRKVAGVVE